MLCVIRMFLKDRERRYTWAKKTNLLLKDSHVHSLGDFPTQQLHTLRWLSPPLYKYLFMSLPKWEDSVLSCCISSFPGNRLRTLKIQELKFVCILWTEGKRKPNGWELKLKWFWGERTHCQSLIVSVVQSLAAQVMASLPLGLPQLKIIWSVSSS